MCACVRACPFESALLFVTLMFLLAASACLKSGRRMQKPTFYLGQNSKDWGKGALGRQSGNRNSSATSLVPGICLSGLGFLKSPEAFVNPLRVERKAASTRESPQQASGG